MDVSIHVNEGILSFQPTALFHHLHVLSNVMNLYIFYFILGNNVLNEGVSRVDYPHTSTKLA